MKRREFFRLIGIFGAVLAWARPWRRARAAEAKQRTETPQADPAWQGMPREIEFREGVPARVALRGFTLNSPTLISINRDPSEEPALAGITWDPATESLVYDGSPGFGAVDNFVFAASSGEQPVHELIMPYSALKPFNNINPIAPTAGTSGIAGKLGTGFADRSAFNNAGPLFFQNMLGDWWDSRGARQGASPFYVLSMASGQSPAPLDVTKLVQSWQEGDYPNFGFFLSPARGGVKFWGNQNAGGNTGPWLDLVFTDRTSAIGLVAAATGAMDTSGYGTWNQPWIAPPCIVFFDLTPYTKKIQRATLRLNAEAWYQSDTATVNVFATRWEGQVAGTPPRLGIAQRYPNDAGLATHPSMIYVETFPDLKLNSRGGWQIKQGYLDQLLAVVGDADPDDPQYHPVRAGIKSLKFSVSPTLFGGIAGRFHFYGYNLKEPTHLFARWYFMLGSEFDPQYPQAGKLSGFDGVYADGNWAHTKLPQTGNPIGRPDYMKMPDVIGAIPGWASVNDFLACCDLHTNPLLVYGMRPIDQYNYLYNNAAYAGNMGYLFSDPAWNHRGILRKNRWYCIDWEIRMNTPGGSSKRPSTSDGILRQWIDGRLAFEMTNVQYRIDPRVGVFSFELQLFSQATGSAQGGGSTKLRWYMAQLAFANDEYIGPMKIVLP